MGRAEMIATPFREYERQIRQQFTDMFARSGFDASRDIAGIILNRWGHAYLSPAPGFFFGKDGKPAPGDVLRAAPFGRIAFANTDLSGVADHRSSIIEADRAVGQLLDSGVSGVRTVQRGYLSLSFFSSSILMRSDFRNFKS